MICVDYTILKVNFVFLLKNNFEKWKIGLALWGFCAPYDMSESKPTLSVGNVNSQKFNVPQKCVYPVKHKTGWLKKKFTQKNSKMKNNNNNNFEVETWKNKLIQTG